MLDDGMLDDGVNAQDRDEADTLMEDLFYAKRAPYRGYAPLGPASIIVPRRMYRAQMYKIGDDADRREVTLYKGITGSAAELWERSARTLIRMRSLHHPSLPSVRDVRSDRHRRVAFTVTELQGQPIDTGWLAAWSRDHQMQAFELFTMLLDALRQMHGARILHRGVTPAAFRRVGGADGGQPYFVLARFEMSILVSNLVRRVARTGVAELQETIRALHLATDPTDGEDLATARARHICYLPPETHEYLFSEVTHSRRDWETTDLFGLGVFGWELFCGPIADTLPDEFEQVRQNLTGPPTISALAEMHRSMREHLARQTSLSEPIKAAVATMINLRPDGPQHHVRPHGRPRHEMVDDHRGPREGRPEAASRRHHAGAVGRDHVREPVLAEAVPDDVGRSGRPAPVHAGGVQRRAGQPGPGPEGSPGICHRHRPEPGVRGVGPDREAGGVVLPVPMGSRR